MVVDSGKRPFSVPTPITTPPIGPQQNQNDLSILNEDASMPIAIVGIGFRGPGDATDVERLWKMIIEGREAWGTIPKARWNNSAFYHPDHARHGTINVTGGHFLEEDVSLFDAPFFNMTSDEAAAMDPQQRLLLEVTYEGLENAGIPLPDIMGTQTSCFVGSFNADYMDLLLRDPDCVPMYQCTNSGQSRAMTANRISYFFDLKGPSVTIDTACSGSLVALHLACQSLRTGDASIAIAAGVNVILSHEFMSTMTMMKFLSPDGRCRTFDDNADGYARGEAIGCLILKPLRDAIKDHDNIRAIIRGSGSNQDGRTSGITLPNGASQEALIRHVYHTAGIDPLDTEFVEAHGTGTQAGDPIETGALARVFGSKRNTQWPLRIGSLKTNVGHLEGTSGIAGVIKAALMLERRMLLPNRNFKELNPRILAQEWNLKVQLQCEPWETHGPHRVSVNSFGYGGSNAHIILEDAEGYLYQRGLVQMVRPVSAPEILEHYPLRPRIFMISAFDETAITNQIERLRDFLQERSSDADDSWMGNLAFTLNERRTAHLYRAAVIVNSAPRMVDMLSTGLNVQKAPRRPTIGFVFTGQGAQWPGMGKELLEAYPVFLQSIQRMQAYLFRIGAPYNIIDEILEDTDTSRLSQPLRSQPICTALQIALVDLLASWGIHPDSVAGHSSGEIAASYAAGALSMEDAMTVAYFRGVVANRLVENDGPPKGAMLAVGMSAAEIEPYIKNLPSGTVTVACINSPSSVTVSGDTRAMEELESEINGKQVFSRRLAVEVAYHSHHMDQVGGEYLASIAHIRARSGKESISSITAVPFFSSVMGKETTTSELGPHYWVQNLLGQVKFLDAVQNLCFETSNPRNSTAMSRRIKRSNAARKASVDCLIEVGPHSALAGPIKQIIKGNSKLDGATIKYGSVIVRKKDAVETSLAVAASLACTGYPVNFQAINNPIPLRMPRRLYDLPPYAWNHTRSYWAEPRASRVFRNREHPRTDLLGVADRFSCPFEPRWRNFIRVSELPWLRDHKIQSNIVYPAAGYIAMAIEAFAQLVPKSGSGGSGIAFVLRDVSILSALVIHEDSAVEVMISLKPSRSNNAISDKLSQFNIYSVTPDSRWTQHCSGYVGTRLFSQNAEFGEMDNFPTTTDSTFSVLDVNHFYGELAKIGLEYGPCFTNIAEAHFTSNTSLAEVKLPDTAAMMPMSFQYPYIIHPCVLDTIVHTVFVGCELAEAPAVPIHLQEMVISRAFPREAGRRIDVCTNATIRGRTDILSSITAASDRDLVLSITGLRCKYIGHGLSETSGKQINRIAYNLKWLPDPSFFPNSGLPDLLNDNETVEHDPGFDKLYEACSLHYVQAAVRDLGELGINYLEPYKKRVLKNLVQVAGIDVPTSRPGRIPVSIEDVELTAKGRLLCAIGETLPEILADSGHTTIPHYDSRLWVAYCDSLQHSSLYRGVTTYLNLMSHKNPLISILEIEACEGSVSLLNLKSLTESRSRVPKCGRYTLTHPDSEELQVALQKLSAWDEWVHTRVLGIDAELKSQSIERSSFDLILVPYGLFTVNSIDKAIRNLHSLLRPGGHLIVVNPIPSGQKLVHAIISSVFTESHLEIMGNVTRLNNALEGVGFSAPFASVETPEGFATIVSKPMNEPSISSPRCLIISEGRNCGVCISDLRNYLESSGHKTEVTPLESAEADGNFCFILSELTAPVLSHINDRDLKSFKNIFRSSAGVLWITRGGQVTPTNPNSSVVTGFARAARSESGVDPIITLDLDNQDSLSPKAASEFIYDLFRKRAVGAGSIDSDTEYAERGGVLLIPRVVEDTRSNKLLSSLHDPYTTSDERFHQQSRIQCVVRDSTTNPTQVRFRHDASTGETPNDHVHVIVHAMGIIGADTYLPSKSQTEESYLASGWAGVVQTVGKNVTSFVPGERVACLGSGIVANTHCTRERAFQKIPSDLSFEEAASLPIIYCTAFYAVRYLARLSPTDTVLIYAGDSILGQAMTEVCHLAEANVCVVVNNTERKNSLATSMVPHEMILVDETGNLTRDIKRINNGKEVDVIINCDYSSTRAFQDLWNYVGASGRVVQVTKTGSNNNRAHWEIPNLQTGVIFATLAIDAILKLDPKLLDDIWLKIGKLLREGKINSHPSLPSYKISEISTAFESLRSGSEEEFMTLIAEPGDIVKTIHPAEAKTLLRPDASYMLIGGLGGIGRATALWMAEHGAKTLIFINRSGLSRDSAKATVEALEKKGVQVIVRALDISDQEQVSTTVVDLAGEAPPIRGVIQAAMVLRDTHIEKMTLGDYHAVLQPKFNGTWNLHNNLPKDLDWFIMLSSISGIIGNATQAAYSAGSTFMDAFAAYRNSLGLHAVSLDLGVITDVGYLAENTELATKMAEQGFQGTDTNTLMSLIQLAMTTPPGDPSMSQIITGLGSWKEGHSLPNFDAPLFAHFRRPFQTSPNGGDPNSAMSTLREDLKGVKTLDDASGFIYAALSAKIAAHLSIPVDNISPSNPITEYGIDSHVAVELRKWISKNMESTVPILEILATVSLMELATRIAERSALVKIEE